MKGLFKAEADLDLAALAAEARTSRAASSWTLNSAEREGRWTEREREKKRERESEEGRGRESCVERVTEGGREAQEADGERVERARVISL